MLLCGKLQIPGNVDSFWSEEHKTPASLVSPLGEWTVKNKNAVAEKRIQTRTLEKPLQQLFGFSSVDVCNGDYPITT